MPSLVQQEGVGGESSDNERVPPTISRPQFRGLSTTAKKRATMSNVTQSIVSRSSTMPGFIERGMTGRQIAYEDGIKLAESRAKVDLSSRENTEKQAKTRRKLNGEALYQGSNSVPESLVQFANEIHDIDRITPKEEKELGAKSQEAIRLQNIYENLATKLDREPTDEEWCAEAGKINMEAISQAIEEGLEAKDRLVTSNLRMVQGVVNIYIRNGLSGQYNAGDLMQEGILVSVVLGRRINVWSTWGKTKVSPFSFCFYFHFHMHLLYQALIRAAEKYDPSRGFRFSTYAMYWIRASVKRSQLYQSRVITVPQRLHESHKRIVQAQADLTKTFGRTPTKKEIGKVVGMSELQVERCIKAVSQTMFSLDQELQNSMKPNSGDKKATMEEIIDYTDADSNVVERTLLRQDLIETLHRHLPEEEVQLLLLRYGLLEADRKTLDPTGATKSIAEVSRIVGYKPDKVRRMISKSLKHMKAIIGKDWSDFEQKLQ